MRLLMLGKGWFPDELGGLDRFYRGLFDALRARGAEVGGVVVGPAENAPRGLRAVARHDDPLPRRLWAFARAASAGAADADVVDAHFALYAALPLLLGPLRRLPLVVHFHGPWADEAVSAGRTGALGHALRTGVERAVYRRADRLVVLSHAFKQVLVERYGVSPWAVQVVPPGVDTAAFTAGDRAAARRRFDVPEDAFVLVCVRRLVPRMGIQVALDALAALARDPSVPQPVLLVAGDGPMRAELEARAAALGLAGRVRFLGRVGDEDVVELYRAADLNLVPSIAFEGFGLIVLEAAACGTASLVSDAGGLPELAATVDPRLVVPAGEPEQLAARLHEIASGEWAPPPADAMRRVATQRSWDANAAATLDVARDAVARRRDGRIRVVYVDHVARLSGAELALLRLLPSLERVDAHVVLGEDGPLVGRLRAAGVSVEVLPLAARARDLRKADVGPRIGPRALLSSVVYAFRLARRLRRLRPDLVHTNSMKAGVYGSVAGRLAGVPVVWHVRDRISTDYLSRGGVALVRLLVTTLPQALVANSSSTSRTIAGRRRRVVIHSVVGEVVEAPEASPAARGSDVLRVGIVGRLAPWKGQDLFLRAFADAFSGDRTRAVVVGSAMFGEEDYARRVVALAEELGIADRVEWRGFREDVWAEFARLDVLVHASLSPEPFGQVVAEGMAAGLPVITTTEGGPSEFVEHERCGLQVPPRDAGALAGAMRRLAADPQLRARLGSAAAAKAREFAPQRIAEAMTGVYEGVIARRTRPSR